MTVLETGTYPTELGAFRQLVRATLAERLQRRIGPPPVRGMGAGDGDGVIEEGRRYLTAMAPGGWGVPSWPVQYGGAGLTRDQLGVLAEELEGYEVPDLYPFSVGLGMVGPVVMAFGTARQQGSWLPSIRTGQEVWCQMFSEPDAGSDLASLSCRAERDGDGWRITGQKLWTSRAHYSRWGLLLARTHPDLPKHRGITAFAVEMGSAGLQRRPLRQINGDLHYNEVFLDEVWVPDEHRIGGAGDGWRVAITTLSHERGAGDRGINGFTPDDVVRLARRFPTTDPVVRQRLARAWSNLKITQLSSLRAEAMRAAGGDPGPGGSGGKLRQVACFKELTALALDLLGPDGITGEDPWATLFLTAPSLSIRGGTDEIQRNIVAERVLGMPAEIRLDKDVPFNQRTRAADGAAR